MNITDPIADMLTRIRNAYAAKHESVSMESSKMKVAIAQILQDEGYIASFEETTDGAFNTLVVKLKYGARGEKIITGIKRISKPGLKIYAGASELPKVLSGLGIAIVSTSKGVMTDKNARKLGIGGEVLAYVW